MRIVHIIVGLSIGGAELMLKRLVQEHHDDTAYRHAVISLTNIGAVGDELQRLGVSVKALGMRSPINLPVVLWSLWRLIRKERPEIVQTWMYHADLIGGLAGRLAGCKNIIWGIRNTSVQAGVSRSTYWVMKACAILSRWVPSHIVCVAYSAMEEHKKYGYKSNKMVVIQNGFDVNQFRFDVDKRKSIRCELGVSSETVIIGSVARYNEYKDHNNFIAAACKISDDYDDVKFLMIGHAIDGNNKALVSLIDKSGYSDRFILLGACDDMPALLSVMDVFCLHSRSEGFPNVVGEAMAVGLPCVVTDVGDASLLLGEAGLIVKPEDPVELAIALRRMIMLGYSRRVQIGAAARRRIEERYSIARVKEKYESLYMEG